MEFKDSKGLSGIALPLNGFVFVKDTFQLHQLQPAHPIKGRHERIDPLVISQDPIYDTAPPVMICTGILINPLRNLRNSILKSSSRCSFFRTSKANHAFRVHAREAITI